MTVDRNRQKLGSVPTSLYPWHRSTWQTWCRALSRNKLAHAQLLYGASGDGKNKLAKRMVDSLLCENRDAYSMPCNQCRGCHLRTVGNHPDLWSRTAESDSFGASMGVDDVREMIEWVALTPLYQGYKIVLIEQLDRMTIAATNALLKTLEEPPPRLLFILTTSMISRIPLTIRSRCCKILSQSPTEQQKVSLLMEHLGIDEAAAGTALQMSQGDIFQAINAFESNDMGLRDDLSRQIEDVWAGKIDIIQAAAEWKEVGVEGVSRVIYQALYDAIRIKKGIEEAVPCVSSASLVSAFTAHFNYNELFLLFDKILDVRHVLLNRVAMNEVLVLEQLAVVLRKSYLLAR